MRAGVRSRRRHALTVSGREYQVQVIEIPFREGVELRCTVDDEELRVSDRGLGEHEALRLLTEAIEEKLRKRS